jgi:hypothetical protein
MLFLHPVKACGSCTLVQVGLRSHVHVKLQASLLDASKGLLWQATRVGYHGLLPTLLASLEAVLQSLASVAFVPHRLRHSEKRFHGRGDGGTCPMHATEQGFSQGIAVKADRPK